MKYLVILTFIMVLFTQGVYGNVNVDLNAAYTRTDDLENQTGIGSTLSFSVMKNVNFFFRGLYHTLTENPNEPDETDYMYGMALGGFQYAPRIGESQFLWISSLGAGMAFAEVEPDDSLYPDINEKGTCVAAWTGILLEATQHLSLYLEAGYHKAFFPTDLEDASIGGLQVVFGIRITIWGKNRGLFADY